MENIGTLYRFEMKKLIQKKLVWICLILCEACILCGCLFEVYVGDVYIDGKRFESNYEASMKDLAYAKALDGQVIDQRLIEKTIAAYRTIPQDTPGHYIGTEEYQRNARPYSTIFNQIYSTTTTPRSQLMYTWEPDEEDYYRMYREYVEDGWDAHYLTEGEKVFWRERFAQVEIPLTCWEHTVYDRLATLYQTVGILTLLAVTVSLAGVFPDEHSRRMDQLNLCGKNGRKALYWAKVLAGAAFAAAVAVGGSLTALVSLLALYGPGHFSAPFQLVAPSYAAPLSCGQAMLIAYGILILTAVLYALLVMAVSELTRNSVAVLSIGGALIILGELLNIPAPYRLVGQIWDWQPFTFLAIWNVFGDLTLPLPGTCLTAWQAVPLIYLLACIPAALLNRRRYSRFQVGK